MTNVSHTQFLHIISVDKETVSWDNVFSEHILSNLQLFKLYCKRWLFLSVKNILILNDIKHKTESIQTGLVHVHPFVIYLFFSFESSSSIADTEIDMHYCRWYILGTVMDFDTHWQRTDPRPCSKGQSSYHLHSCLPDLQPTSHCHSLLTSFQSMFPAY